MEEETLPKVSILIPTYNRPDYFELALNSALHQTYPNLEIIVGDDSTNDQTEKLIKKYLLDYPHIFYYKNDKNLGQFANSLKLFDQSSGEYINFLMDDDLFHPQKIEKMMLYFLNDPREEIKLVTSHRQLINEKGEAIPDIRATRRLFEQDTVREGIGFGNYLIRYNFNCIGEPTTVLIRKKDLTEPFGVFNGREYGCNVDVATWLNLMSKGKMVYIAETLSYFRFHKGQQLHSKEKIVQGANDYAREVLDSPKKGFFQDLDIYRHPLNNAFHLLVMILRRYIRDSTYFLSIQEVKKNLGLIAHTYHERIKESLELDDWIFHPIQFIMDSFRPDLRKYPWVGHRFFAYDLVRFLKPKSIVELGTHYGSSFFSFSQAVKDGNIPCNCYAIDTWEGDRMAGFYGQEVYDTVNRIAQEFPHFTHLMRMTFDNALQHFEDGSIDLLHIDGLHTFEAVCNDYETWLPKLADRGIVLFHDIEVRHGDFGVYKLWNELKTLYPHLEFHHSYGLGVLFPKGLSIHLQKMINLQDILPCIYHVKADAFSDWVDGRMS